MADVQIEGLEFDISADSGKASQSLDGLISTLQSLKSAIKGNGLKSLSENLSAISNIKISEATISSINRLADSLKNLSSVSGSLKDVERLVKAQNTVPKMNPTTPQETSVTPKESGIETSQGGIEEIANSAGRLASILDSIKARATSAGQAIKNIPGSVASFALNKLKSAASSAANELGKLAKQAMKVGGSALLSPIKAPIEALGSLKEQFAEASKAATGLLRSFGRIAMYRAIRFFFSQLTGSIKEGINNLYQYSALMGGTFKGSMDSLASSFQYLKNSMGAMAAPIITAIAPAVDYLIGKFVDLLNIINEFFARLSGASFFTKAKKQAVSYGSAVGSAGKAAKQAAKDIELATLGIDELHVLPKQNSNSGNTGSGSGSSTPDYGSMFEKVPINNGIKDFTDNLKAAIDEGDWKSVGTLLGKKFNQLADSIDWKEFGKKVGYGINGAVQSSYQFLKTADFKKLGQHIADFMNSGMKEIDFTFVGRLLVRGVTSGLDFLIGFLGKLDWGLVGKSLGDFLRGSFDEASEWIASYDWGKMADSVYKNIKKFLLGIDFADVARSFFKALGAAFGAAVAFSATFVSDIVDDIAGYFKQYINTDGDKHWWEIGADIIGGIFNGIVDAVKNIAMWIWNNVFKPFEEGFKSTFGIHSPAKNMKPIGKNIILGVFEGILDFMGGIVDWVKEHIVDPLNKAIEDNPVSKLIIKVKNDSSEWWENVKEWWREKSEGGVSVKASVKLLKDKWEDIGEWVQRYPGGAVHKGIGLLKDKWNDLGEWVNRFKGSDAYKPIGLMKSGWSNLAEWVNRYPGGYVSKGIGLLRSGWNTVSGWVSGYNGGTVYKGIGLLHSGWWYVSSWVYNYIGGPVSKVIDLAKGWWGTVADWVGGHIGGAVSVTVTLVRGWTGSIRKWLGLSSGGIVSPHGFKLYEKGGVIPMYANGTTAPNHGSMFVAGENGAELVGHIGGRTEVMNRFQLASVMYTSVSAAIREVTVSIFSQIATCTNAVLQSLGYIDRDVQLAYAGASGTYAKVNAVSEEYMRNVSQVYSNDLVPYEKYDKEDMENAMYNAFMRVARSDEIGDKNINLYLDGEIVYKDVVRRNNQHVYQTGESELKV